MSRSGRPYDLSKIEVEYNYFDVWLLRSSASIWQRQAVSNVALCKDLHFAVTLAIFRVLVAMGNTEAPKMPSFSI